MLTCLLYACVGEHDPRILRGGSIQDSSKLVDDSTGQNHTHIWDYFVAWVKHWDDLPSNPFKILVACSVFMFGPFAALLHYLGHFMGLPILLDSQFGQYFQSAHNISTLITMATEL
jgi:hypothetical protein